MRQVGALLPISALPGAYAVGDFGPEAYTFAKKLKRFKFSHWQILPLNPLGLGNSPYQSSSSHALDIIYVSPYYLFKAGLLKKLPKEIRSENVDYKKARKLKEECLKEAFHNFKGSADYASFSDKEWVQRYGIYASFRSLYGDNWTKWEKEYRDFPLDPDAELVKTHLQAIQYHIFCQYILYKQFFNLKAYLNKLGISLIGDLPFYVGLDSDDVYFNRECFLLDEDYQALKIAGVPPDYFNPEGQRWDNPIYDWKALKENSYEFYFERLKHANSLYDVVRIDHFRAFDSYWQIDTKDNRGEWVDNDGTAFFTNLFKEYPNLNLIVEDLGNDLGKGIQDLKDKFKLLGMQVIQFSLFANIKEDIILYSGTHDNESLRSFIDKLSEGEQDYLAKRLKLDRQHLCLSLLCYLLQSRAKLVILALPDILYQKERINDPGTMNERNWTYRLKDYKGVDKKLRNLSKYF